MQNRGANAGFTQLAIFFAHNFAKQITSTSNSWPNARNLLFAFLLILLLLPISYAISIPISSCQALSSANADYTLTASPAANSGVCFNVTAQNITLDCMGYTLTGTNVANNIAVNITNQPNITVRNCIINSFSRGIFVTGDSADFANITNNTITQTYSTSCSSYTGVCSGIFLNDSDFSFVSNNPVNVYDYGIQLSNNSNNNTVQYNNVTTGDDGIIISFSHGNLVQHNNASTGWFDAISIVNGSNNLVQYNNASSEWFSFSVTGENNTYKYNNLSSEAREVFAISGSNTTVEHNNIFAGDYTGITVYGSNNTLRYNRINLTTAILIYNGDGNLVEGNNLTGPNCPIKITTNSYSDPAVYNKIQYNNINASNGSGVCVESPRNNITGNNITANSNDSTEATILIEKSFMGQDPDYLVISNNTILGTNTSASSARLIAMGGYSDHGIYYNNTMISSAPSSTYAIAVAGYNNTFYKNNITSSLWVSDNNYDYGINHFNYSGVGNIYYFINGTPSWQVYNITCSDGTNWTDGGSNRPFNDVLSEWAYYGNDYHPFTNKSGVYEDPFNFSICTSLDAGGTTYTLNSNISASGTCFSIIANNITLDCAGYTISGPNTSSTYGVYVLKNNATIRNCKINYFNAGIFLPYNAYNANVTNNTINTTMSCSVGSAGCGAIGISQTQNASIRGNRLYGSSNVLNFYEVNSGTIHNHTIEGNNITATGSTAASLTQTRYVKLIGNRFSSNSTSGSSGTVYFTANSSYTTFANNTVNSVATGSDEEKPIYIAGANYSTFYNNTLITNSSGSTSGIHIAAGNLNNVFYANNITAPVWVNDSGSGNIYNYSRVGNEYHFKNGTGSWLVYNISDTGGDYWADVGTARPFNSSMVNGNLTGSGNPQDWHPFSANSEAALECSEISTPNSILLVTKNLSINDSTCLNITADNVSIDCGNYFTISGNNASGTYSIYSTGYNTTVTGCRIENFSAGIYLNGSASNGFIYWNTFNITYAGGSGIQLGGSGGTHAIRANSIYSGSSSIGISAESGSGNSTIYNNSFFGAQYYVNNSNSTNNFNYSNSTDALGNYYENILTTNINDTDGDEYGDQNTPYNASNSGTPAKWSGVGGDWGPRNASTTITQLSGCGNATVAGITYLLVTDVYGGPTCINISAENVTLDCAGHTITGTNASETFGVYTNKSNITIKNCLISNYTAGIYINGDTADYATITNNTINQTYSSSCSQSSYYCTAIYLRSSDWANISKNRIYAYQYAINLYYNASNCTISENNVTSSSSYGIQTYSSCVNNTIWGNRVNSSSYSIYLGGDTGSMIQYNVANASNNAIQVEYGSGNTVQYNNVTTSSGGYPIQFTGGSNGTIQYNNANASSSTGIYTSGTTIRIQYNNLISPGPAVYINSGSSNNVSYNNITATTGAAVYLASSSTSNRIQYNNLTSSGSYGVYLSGSSVSSNIIEYNNITALQYALYLESSNSNTFRFNNATATNRQAIYLSSSSSNSIYQNNISSPSATSTYGAIHLLSNSNANTFSNNTVNQTATGSNEERLIYIASGGNNTFFNNTLYSSASDSTPAIYACSSPCGNNTFYQNNITSSTWVSNSNTTNIFNRSGIGNIYYYRNGTGAWEIGNGTNLAATNPPNWSSSGYGVNATNFASMWSGSGTDSNAWATNGMLGACANISNANIIYYLSQNISANGSTCINISAQNVTLNCNGFTISGNNSSNTYGVYSNGSGAAIWNCQIRNFSSGIFLPGASNSNVSNNTINITFAGGAGLLLSAAGSGNNTFNRNNITAPIWVNDSNGSNYYNNSNSGNIYYYSNGTGAWAALNGSSLTTSSPPNWSTSGYGVNATNFPSYWIGNGTDYFAWTNNSATIDLQCSNLSTPNTAYNLTSNLSSSSHCFNITASNVTLDGNNKLVNGSIHVDGVRNVTIRNIRLDPEYGLVVNATNDSSFINLSITNVSVYGIWVTNSSNNNNFTNISINTTGSAHGIYVDSGQNNSFDCQSYSILGTNTSDTYGAYSNQFNTTIKNCKIFNFGNGIRLIGSINSTLLNNFVNNSAQAGILLNQTNWTLISNCTSNSSVHGFYLYSCGNNTLSNNFAFNNNQAGFHLYSSSDNILLNNLDPACGPPSPTYAYWLESNSSRNQLFNNTARDVSYGFYLDSYSDWNNLANNTAINCSSAGFHVGGNSGANFNNFTNSTVINSTNGISSYASCHVGDNNNFTGITLVNMTNYGMTLFGSNNTYDCLGGAVTGTNTSTYYGVATYNSNNNATVKNCIIANFSDVLHLGWAPNGTFYNNTLNTTFAGGNAIWITGGSTTFLANNITGQVWVNDSNGSNIFNNSNSGNIYYFKNGTPSWSALNGSSLTTSNPPNWSTSGYGVNATNFASYWLGNGTDYFAWTNNSAPTDLQCSNLSTPNTVYNMTSNLSINGSTCFNITAQNVTLDCAGKTITGDNSTSTWAVYSENFNTTIKNCIISNFSGSIGISGAGANYSNITNNTIRLYYAGSCPDRYLDCNAISLKSASHGRVSQNQISVYYSGWGISLNSGSQYGNVLQNNVTFLNLDPENTQDKWGIILLDSERNVLSSNQVSDADQDYIIQNSNFSNITNNLASGGIGFVTDSGSNNRYINNSAANSSTYGFTDSPGMNDANENNTYSGNNATNISLDAFSIANSNNLSFTSNSALNSSRYGFAFSSLSSSTVYGNLANQTGMGFFFYSTSGNSIYDNTADNFSSSGFAFTYANNENALRQLPLRPAGLQRSFEIKFSNMSIDCGGQIIGGNGGTGLHSTNSTLNVTNCNFQNFSSGIDLEGSRDSIIANNSISLPDPPVGNFAWLGRHIIKDPESSGLSDFAASSDLTKLVSGTNPGRIFISNNSGETWNEMSGSEEKSWGYFASSSDGNKLAAAALNDYIFTSDDSGQTWAERTNSGMREWAQIVSSADGTKLAATVFNGYIYTSPDSGATWDERTGLGQHAWGGIAISSDGTKLLVSDNENGSLYTSIDLGASWTNRSAMNGHNWVGVAMSSDGTMLAAAAGMGYIYTSSNSGADWTERTGSGMRNWGANKLGISSDGTKLAAADYDGYIYVSEDSGLNWAAQNQYQKYYLQKPLYSANGSRFAIMDGSNIFYQGSPRALTSHGSIGLNFTNNTINSRNSTAILSTDSSGSVYLLNNITAGIWVNETGGPSIYNASSFGNIYYYSNGTGAWAALNGSSLTTTSPPNWSTSGYGVNSTNFASQWIGNGTDYFAWTNNSAPTDLQCSNLSTANTVYNMTQNLTSSGTCFNITSDNVTLDCAGFSITGANASTTTGVNITAVNATVKNCIISNFSTGIMVSGDAADYANITNNTITTTYNTDCSNADGVCNAIFVNEADYSSISSNWVFAYDYAINLYLNANLNTIQYNNASTSNRYAISISSSSNNTIQYNNASAIMVAIRLSDSNNNTIQYNNASTLSDEAIYLSSSSNNTVQYNDVHATIDYVIRLTDSHGNTIQYNNASAQNGGYAVSLFSSSNNTVQYNNATVYSLAIYLSSSSNNTIQYNNASASSENALFLETGSNYNNISGNRLASDGNFSSTGTVSISDSDYTYLFNNTINQTASGPDQERPIMFASGYHSTVINNTVLALSSTSTPAIELAAISGNNTFYNNNITAGIWVWDANVSASGASTNNYNSSNAGNIYYYSNGTGAWAALNGSSLTTSSPPNWSTSGYGVNATNFASQWSGSGTDYFAWTNNSAPTALQCSNLSTANTVYNMTQNLTSSGTCFNFTAANVTLNCSGYAITGNNSSSISAIFSNVTNSTVLNCTIRNFSIGINFASASNYSSAYGNNITAAVWVKVDSTSANNKTSTVAEDGTASLSCNANTYIMSYTSLYGVNCGGTCPASCGTCTIGASSCSVTYNNSNCGDCNFGCSKNGQLNLTCAASSQYNKFNLTNSGNIYYFQNGTLASDAFPYAWNPSAPTWSSSGWAFNAAHVGGNWSGPGDDYYPYTNNSVNPDLNCSNLSTPNTVYNMTAGLFVNSTTCFNITAPNITLDGRGYTITGNNTAGAFGIYSNQPNTTIKNVGLATFSIGVYLNNSNWSTLQNNTVSENAAYGMGIYVFNGSNLTIIENRLSPSAATYGLMHGMYLNYSRSILVANNSGSGYSSTDCDEYDCWGTDISSVITSFNSSYMQFINNTLNLTGSDNAGGSILASSNDTNNTIANNTLRCYGAGTALSGTSGSGHTVYGNRLNTSMASIYSYSINAPWAKTNAYNNTLYQGKISFGSTNSNFTNNTVLQTLGASFSGSATYNNFSGSISGISASSFLHNWVNSTNGYLYRVTANSVVANNTLMTSATSGVFLTDCDSISVTIANNTINASNGTLLVDMPTETFCEYGSCEYCYSSNLRILNNTIGARNGFSLIDSSGHVIANNTFTFTNTSGVGILHSSCGGANTYINNTFISSYSNTTGFNLSCAAAETIVRNTFNLTGANSTGVYSNSSSGSNVSNNTIWVNGSLGTGILLGSSSSGASFYYNNITAPLWVNNTGSSHKFNTSSTGNIYNFPNGTLATYVFTSAWNPSAPTWSNSSWPFNASNTPGNWSGNGADYFPWTANTQSPSLQCSNLSTANTVYNMSQNLSINGATCFNITAQNVTLNCNGSSIIGDNSSNTYGIYSNSSKTSIFNCRISNFSNGIGFGIVSSGNNDTRIINNTVSTTYSLSFALSLGYSGAYVYNNLIVDNNNISSSYGAAQVAVLVNSSISNNNLSSASAPGIDIYDARGQITNNTITSSSKGVYLSGTNLQIQSNNISVSGGNGIEFVWDRSDTNINMSGNRIQASNFGIYMGFISEGGMNSFIIDNNDINVSSNSTLYATNLYGGQVLNNRLNSSGDNIVLPYYNHVMAGDLPAYNMTFMGNNITSTSGAAIALSNISREIRFFNNSLIAPIWVNNSNLSNTFNTTGMGNIYYYPNGTGSWAALNGSSLTTSSPPNWSTSNYGVNATNFPSYWIGNGTDYFAWTNNSAPTALQCSNLSTANTIYNMTQNLSVNGTTCFNITAQNVTLDCNGYGIAGNLSLHVFAIFINAFNATVKNCAFTDYSCAVNISSAGAASTIQNNTIVGGVFNTSGGVANTDPIIGIQSQSADNLTIDSNRMFNLVGKNATGSGNFCPAWGVYILGGNNHLIRNNTLINLSIGSTGSLGGVNGYGIYLEYSNNSNISGNTISNVTGKNVHVSSQLYVSGYGIYLYYDNQTLVSGNQVTQNGATTQSAFYSLGGSALNLTLNNLTAMSGNDRDTNAVAFMSTQGSTISLNQINATSSYSYGMAFGIYSSNSLGGNSTFYNNTIVATSCSNYTAVRFVTGSNVLYGNNFTSYNWVNDSNGTNKYNNSNSGNIYYFANGTGAWAALNGSSLTTSSPPNWSTSGYGVNATNFASQWSGSGTDYFAWTNNAPAVPQVCGNLSTANTVYTMTQNVSVNGFNCFNITAQNVTLDCAGYTITGNNSTSTSGIYSTQANSTIKNCILQNFSTGISIDGNSADFANITNNTINLTYRTSCDYSNGACNGIYLRYADNATIIANRVDTYSYAIDLYSNSDANYLEGNNATSSDKTLYAGSSSNNIILSNNFTTTASYAVLASGGSNLNNFTNNSVYGSNMVFSLADSDYNTLYGNNITTTGSSALYLQSPTCLYNNVTNNSFIITSNSAGTGAVQIANDGAAFTNFSYNRINSTSSSANSANPIYLFSGMNNTFMNNTLGVASSGGTAAIYIASVSGNNTFLYNNLTSALWVNDSNGTNKYNNSNSGNIYYYSNGTGAWAALNGSSLTTTSPPNWSTSGYGVNATNFASQWTGSGTDFFAYTNNSPTYLQCSNLSTANTVYNMTQNLTSAGSCFNITAQNVTLDCAGFSITGGNSSSTFGVYSTQPNSTIKNCNIQNFSSGVYAGNSATFMLVQNNTINTTHTSGNAIYLLGNNPTLTMNVLASYDKTIEVRCNNANISSNSIRALNDKGIVTNYDYSNVTITRNNITAGHQYGVSLTQSTTNIVEYNQISVTGALCTVVVIQNAPSTTIRFNNLTCSASSSSILETWDFGTPEVDNLTIYGNIINSSTSNPLFHCDAPTSGYFYNNQLNSTVASGTAITTSSACTGLVLYNNTIKASIWINGGSASTQFNYSGMGNIYYFPNSTGSWQVFDIVDTSGDTWADAGSKRPFNATTVGGNWSGSGSDWFPYTAIHDNAPNISYINLSPASPLTTENLTCNITSVDDRNATLSVSFEWYKNGANQSSLAGNYSSISNNTNTTVSTLYYAGNLTAGDNWSCNVRVYDSYQYSSWNMSSNVTITQSALSCSNLNTANTVYNMTTNLSSSGACINITAANITLECNGYSITGTNGTAYGVQIRASNATVQNCIISNYSAGIFVDDQNRSSIFNNTILTTRAATSYGIYTFSPSSYQYNHSIANNTINSTQGYGFYLDSIRNSSVHNNTIRSGDSYAITLAYSDSNNFTNNTIIAGNSTNPETAIYFTSTSTSNRFYHNNITASTWVNTGALTNYFNTTGMGNIYYFANGTPSWSVFDIWSSSPSSPWASNGAKRPFSPTTVGANWSGNGGSDNFPYTENIGAAPNVTAINLTPLAPASNQDLYCNITANDSENSTLIAFFEWYKNGANQTSLNGSATISNNSNSLVATLYYAGNLSSGDNWSCRVRVYDSYRYSPWSMSSNRTVTQSGTAPNITSISILPVNATASDNLSCRVTVLDYEQSSINVSYSWYLNGTLQPSLSGSMNVTNNTPTIVSTIEYGNLSWNDLWSCEALASDGIFNSSANITQNITIGEPYRLQSCRNLSTAGMSYNLTEHITGASNRVCINITADNITLNGAGNGIFGIVHIAHARNIHVNNLHLDPPYGLIVNDTNDSLFTNISAYNVSIYGIWVTNSSNNNTFTNISINTTDNGSGIYVDGGSNNTFDCLGGLIIGQNSSIAYGIYSNQPNTTLKNCRIADFNTSIYLDSGASASLAQNNTLNASSGGIGLRFGENAGSCIAVGNAIQASVWVNNSNSTNSFNYSGAGNYYYFANSTPAYEVYDLYDSNSDGWADGGASWPINSTNAGGNWSGVGADWAPYTQNANSAPSIASMSMGPPSPSLPSNITCNVSASDNEQSSLTLNITWRKNGANYSSIAVSAANGTVYQANLSINSSFTQGGDNWSCAAFASDGMASSAINHSSNITVASAGTIGIAANITFENASAGHWFYARAVANHSAGGGNVLNVTIYASAGTCSQLSNSTAGVNFSVVYNCSTQTPASASINLTFYSSNGNASTNTASNTYPNKPSSMSSPFILPIPALEASNLSCNAGTFGDEDGDLENTSARQWAWYRNGSAISGANTNILSSGNFSDNDTLICQQSAQSNYSPFDSIIRNSSEVTIGYLGEYSPTGAKLSIGTPFGLPIGASATASIMGGNVTQLDLEINSTTLHWQGFFGSINGSLSLESNQTGARRVMKDWAVNISNAKIYASRSDNIHFENLPSVDFTLSHMDSAFSSLNGSDDSANNTGIDNANPAFSIGAHSVAANSKPLIPTYSATGGKTWKMVVLNDGNLSDKDRYVFMGVVNDSGVSYSGLPANYQIVVPADAGDEISPTSYYFYAELD